MSDTAYIPKTSTGIWHSLNHLMLTLIALAAAVPICYSFRPEVDKHTAQDARVEELKAEILTKRLTLGRHQREENLLKHDPEYLGLIARDRLDLMKEGETIYRVGVPTSNQVQSKQPR